MEDINIRQIIARVIKARSVYQLKFDIVFVQKNWLNLTCFGLETMSNLNTTLRFFRKYASYELKIGVMVDSLLPQFCLTLDLPTPVGPITLV